MRTSYREVIITKFPRERRLNIERKKLPENVLPVGYLLLTKVTEEVWPFPSKVTIIFDKLPTSFTPTELRILLTLLADQPGLLPGQAGLWDRYLL